MRKSAFHNDAGFTVIELMVTVAVLMILTSMAITPVRRFVASTRLRASTDALKRQITVAKTRSVGNPDVNCGVFFDVTAEPQEIIIFFDDNADGSFDPDEDEIFRTVWPLRDGISMEVETLNGDEAIVFSGDGTTENPGHITVENNFGEQRTLAIISTGRVRTE